MKTTFLSIASLLVAFSMAGHNKINDEGWQILQSYKEAKELKALSTSSTSGVDESYCVLATLDDNTTAADLEAKGYKVYKQRANMVLMQIPTADIEKFAENDFVEALSFGIKATPLNDLARKSTYVTDVVAGTGLGADGGDQPYTGKGVLTGIFDVGVDPNHAAFYNADGTENRVKAVYKVTSTGADSKYTTSSAIANFTTDSSSGTHGTHTAATMAGGYRGKVRYLTSSLGTVKTRTGALPYYGVATESDILIGCGSSDVNSIYRSFEYMVDYAKNHNQPLVLNLSFGLIVGSHDGTSASCKYLSEIGKEAILCIAAGNDADYKIALTKTLTDSDTELKSFLVPYTSLASSNSTRYADIWSTKSTAPKLTIVIYKKSTGETLYSKDWSGITDLYIGGSSMSATTYNKPDAFVSNFSARSMLKVSGSKNSTNNRYDIKIYANLVNSSTNTDDVLVGFIVSDDSGTRFDATTYYGGTDDPQLSFSNYSVAGWDDGGGEGTISELACSNNIIAVGAYNTRATFYTLGGGYGSYTGDYAVAGAIAPYSSFGTRIDGTKLPTVCAPGTGIISAYNSYYTSTLSDSELNTMQAVTDGTFTDGRTYYWACSQGTSMACPHAAGIIGLWLQADPTLTVDRVKQIIETTSTVDTQVSSAANPIQWGAGKINAYAGIKAILSTSGVGDITRDEQDRLLISMSSDNINVLVAGENNLDARLYSVSGVQVAGAVASSNELNVNVASVTPGVYVLDVKGENAHYVKKIVIRK